MFTTCAACRMNLAVTPSDLRVGQGYVRCGRCNHVFNALLALSEDVDQDEQPELVATGTTTVPALEDPGEHAAAENVTAAPPTDKPHSDEPQSDDDSNWAQITPIRKPATPDADMDLVESQSTGTFETIVLEGDGYLQTEEHVDELEVDAQLREMARQMDTRNAGTARDNTPTEVHPDEDIVMQTDVQIPELEPELDADAAVGNRRRHHGAWQIAAAMLALLLIAQLVHHNRQALVAHPWFQRPMQALYAVFGVTLEPRWDLHAYEVRHLGNAETLPGADDRIVLRATVQNRAPNSQPPPLIRAVLKDRFENTLSTSAIAPADYLRGTPPSRMAPDQRLDATLTLSDPTRQAAGFEIDACLPGAGSKLHCSNDP